MKKIFTFAAALLSVAAFAFEDGPVPATVPSTADFNAYKAEGANMVVGFYTEAEVCNDIVWMGTVNGWTYDAAAAITFEAMEGFTNWYVCSFADASASICGKPIQLKSDGSFAWDYQVGNQISLISGTATITDGYSGEVNIEGLGTDAPVVLAAGIWKNGGTPCVAVPTHEYTVTLDAPLCADAEGNYFDPAIIGSFNGWAEGVAMTLDEATGLYSYTFTDEEGHEFKFKAVGDTDWSNQIQLYDADNDLWYDNGNVLLGEETELYFDYSAGRYTLCAEATAVENVEVKKATKVVENGQLILIVDGVRYNTVGAIVK